MQITSQRNKYVYSIPLLILGVLLLILIILNPNTQNETVKSHGISILPLYGSLLFIGFSFVIYLLEKIQEFKITLDNKVLLKIGKKDIQLNPSHIVLLRSGVGYKILIKNKSKIKLPKLIRIWEIWGSRKGLMIFTLMKRFNIITPEVILTKDEQKELENYCKKHSIDFEKWNSIKLG